MDAIYFFRHSNFSDQELVFSLRGVAQNMPWIRKVWIFGDRPSFISLDESIIEHVPHEYVACVGDYQTPLTNFFLMLYTSSLIPGLAPEYLWFCDDFICIDAVSPELATKTRCLEDLNQVNERGGGLWKDSLWRTYDLLARLGYPGYNFETHSPTYFTKRRVLEAWCDFQDFVTEDRWFGMLGPTAILNHACLTEDLDVTYRDEEGTWAGFYERQPRLEEIQELTTGKQFMNFDDAAYGDTIAGFLNQMFPDACKYERHDMPENSKQLEVARTTIPTEISESITYPKATIRERKELAHLLNHRKLLGEGVQIGVTHGLFSETILREWRGRRLHCVDSWLAATDDPKHIDKYNLPQEHIDHFYNEARRRLASFADRCHLHRMRPADASRFFDDGSLSFVYIVEKHYFEAVWEHLETWAPKVQSGGILAGHNYLDGTLPSGHFEVKRAVDAWAGQRGLTVECSGEHVWRSWFITMP